MWPKGTSPYFVLRSYLSAGVVWHGTIIKVQTSTTRQGTVMGNASRMKVTRSWPSRRWATLRGEWKANRWNAPWRRCVERPHFNCSWALWPFRISSIGVHVSNLWAGCPAYAMNLGSRWLRGDGTKAQEGIRRLPRRVMPWPSKRFCLSRAEMIGTTRSRVSSFMKIRTEATLAQLGIAGEAGIALGGATSFSWELTVCARPRPRSLRSTGLYSTG